jgi:hypothetical protein
MFKTFKAVNNASYPLPTPITCPTFKYALNSFSKLSTNSPPIYSLESITVCNPDCHAFFKISGV